METWYQLATTDDRVLAVQLQKSPTGSYQPTKRLAASKATVHINRYAATTSSPARIELTGLDIPITIVDIDRPDIFPLIEPFIVSWGGRLGGDGTHRPSIQHGHFKTQNEKKLVLIAAGLLSATIFFCGCAGVLGGVIAYTQGSQ